MGAAPRGYPATYYRLTTGFVVGVLLSVLSVAIGLSPLIVAALAGVLSVPLLSAAAAGMILTSAAWVGAERVSADTDDPTDPDETIQTVAENAWSFAVLFALLVLYTNLLALTAVGLATVVATSSSGALAAALAFHVVIIDMVLARRFTTSPVGLVIYVVAVALDYDSAGGEGGPDRIPLVGLRLPGGQSSGSTVP